MKSLVLMVMIFATLFAPIHHARDPRPARGLRRLGWTMFTITVIWGLLIRYVYPSL